MKSTIAIVVCACGMIGTGCGNRPAPVTMEAVWADDAPDQEGWDARIVLSEHGTPRVHMTAAYLAAFERKDSTYTLLTRLADGSESVLVTVFDAAGDTSATVTAEQVYWFDRENRMEARGDVVVVSANGRRLEAEHLSWFDAEQTISTPGFARIHLEDGILEGYGLLADEGLADVRLSNVTGNMVIEDD